MHDPTSPLQNPHIHLHPELQKYLCMPVWPFKAGKRDPPTFFATDAWLGILTAMVMGLQHAMAMVGGLIT